MKKITYILLAIFFLAPIASCDIDEVIYDEALGKDLLGNASDESFLAPSYAVMRDLYLVWSLFAVQEYTSDEAMLPTRGSDWFDNGVYQEYQTHSWTPKHGQIRGVWNNLVKGISNSLQTMSLLEESSPLRAEAQALLAHYMSLTLDLFGQVPYRDINNIDFSSTPIILSGNEAVETIASLLESALPKLPETAHNSRMTKSAAKGLLAKLYLNKAVYVDRYAENFNFQDEDMQKVISLCTEIIESNKYSLTSDYFSMFSAANDNHSEIIFAAKFDYILDNNANRVTGTSVSRGLFSAPGIRGSDGSCTLPEFLDLWDTSDPRYYKENYPNDGSVTSISSENYQLNRGFLEGQQYGAEREDLTSNSSPFKLDSDGNFILIPIQSTRDLSFANHTRAVKLIAKNQSTGVRVTKWEYDKGAGSRKTTNTDVSILRLADVYLMRAEANLRLASPVSASALADVNTVRNTRKAGFGLSSVGLNEVYLERSFEFYWEFMRRTDQIRFGAFEDTWTEKTSTDKFKRIFPIPESVVPVTTGLDQNPGY